MNFSPKDYQAENQNWSIDQDDEKNIYIANNKGLLRYNGARWKLYPSPNKTIIRAVNAEGEKIYIGCHKEFGFWTKNANNILTYTSLSQTIEDKLSEDEDFWNIVSYDEWVLFQSLHRIYLYNNEDKSFQIVSSENILPKVFKVDKHIYFQKMNEGLFKFENGKIELVSDASMLKEYQIINIFHIENDLLIHTQNKGFYLYREGRISPWQHDLTSIINDFNIYSSTRLKDRSYILGTISNGIYHLSSKGTLLAHINQEKGLQNNTVLSVYEDADNNLWLGLDNGISLINRSSPYRVYHDNKGLLGTVYAAAEYEGNLFLGTNQGLFYKPINSTHDFRQIANTKGQVWKLRVWDGTLFCGHNSGTFIIENQEPTLISDFLGTWDIKPIVKTNNLMLQGTYEGLHILERKNNTWVYRNKIEGFDISSRYFELLPKNRIIVNHEYKGVFKLTVSDDYRKVIHIEKEHNIPKSPKSGIVTYKNQLLYLSDSGIYSYRKQNDCFIKDSALSTLVMEGEQYLSGNSSLTDDNLLWIFTQDNIISLSTGKIDKKLRKQIIPLPSNVSKNMIGYENILHLNNNLYLLGTTNGYILFDLKKIETLKKSVKISAVAKHKINETSSYIPINQHECTLKSNENNLHFDFYVPYFDAFSQTKYQYKLVGLENDWEAWTTRSSASFSNLPPARYTFMVRAKTGNELSENIAEFTFKIAKPWYLSNWMMAMYMLLIAVFIIILNRFYRARYRKQKLKLIEKQRREIALLQLKNDKEIMTLRNEKLRNEIDAKKRELATATMDVVKNNDLLNSIKNELFPQKENLHVKKVFKIIDKNLSKDNDWETFEEAFNNTDRDFLQRIKTEFPTLTPNDLKLCTYLRLNLSSKEIAPLLNISPRSVEIKRYRLRKKLALSHQQNLTDFILNY